ncbi:MAG: hypothetical protein KTR31_29455 [Myxococcales bacterium]|nr:hypothetical protein [Myxococcales bacterium]
MRLVIDKTWDGAPLPEAEHAWLELSLEAQHLVIRVDAPYAGDPAPEGPAGPTDGLWSYEVVELFVVGAEQRYAEIELSPHGHHWVLQLEGIRNPVVKGIAIEHTPRIEGRRWRATARVPRKVLPDEPRTCNAFRIVGVPPSRRYLACFPVPGDGPNFHRLEHFGPWPEGLSGP